MMHPLSKDEADICLIIPALNEGKNLVRLLPRVNPLVTRTIVVDNGSVDDTARVARAGGAVVVTEPVRGYGNACLSGVAAAGNCDLFVFMDADLSDEPNILPELVTPILRDEADFVLGSRMGPDGYQALSFLQRNGNRFACTLMRLIWGVEYTDLGPFRAISHRAYGMLEMKDRNYGWTIEMQIKVRQRGLRIKEIEVPYRHRVFGVSKVSGSLLDAFRAGFKILLVIARQAILKGGQAAQD